MSSGLDESMEFLLSKGLYRILSDVVGPECIVKLRREKWNISNVVNTKEYINIMSGSRAEGFRMKTSDFDVVYVAKNTIVVQNLSQLRNDTGEYIATVLALDCDYAMPGSALIKCLILDVDESNDEIKASLVQKENDYYLSSNIFREFFLQYHPSTVSHGPSQTGILLENEYDSVYCLKCAVWPKKALPFVYRSLKAAWPESNVLREICQDGCLLAPVTSKHPLCNDSGELEWRLSFVMAEKRLVHAMNHTQFLCYGLLKIVLKEILDKKSDLKELLTSYFMKTAVFWEIQNDSSNWTAQNIMTKFWTVFKRIIKWVQIGYIPNFFIPENNMCFGRIHGEQQGFLKSELCTIYKDGLSALLICPSLTTRLTTIISQPETIPDLSLEEDRYVNKYHIVKQELGCIFVFDDALPKDSISVFKAVYRTLREPSESSRMHTALNLRARALLQRLSELILLAPVSPNYVLEMKNRHSYKQSKGALEILKNSRTYFGSSQIVIAKCFYVMGQYRKAIVTLENLKSKMQGHKWTYRWIMDKNVITKEISETLSQEEIIRKYIMNSFEEVYLSEVSLERLTLKNEIGVSFLTIPPLVLVYFLLFLSYNALGITRCRQEALCELKSWVENSNDSDHIISTERFVSLEILGICYQMCGQYRPAFESYKAALGDKYNAFKQATIIRLEELGF